MRGQFTIFNSLLEDEQPQETLYVPERKGRSEHLVNKRNELLICRYYYYVKILGRQYPVTIKALEDEVFLTGRTIIDTIAKNHELLKQLHTTKPEPKYFKTKFPFIMWPEPAKAN